jgi:hypothetical protein
MRTSENVAYVCKETKKQEGRKKKQREKKFVVAFLPMYSLHHVLQNNSGRPISKE